MKKLIVGNNTRWFVPLVLFFTLVLSYHRVNAEKKDDATPIHFSLNLPYISTITGPLLFSGTVDISTGAFSFGMEQENIPEITTIIPGILTFNRPVAGLSNKGLSWSSVATIFGKPAKVGLLELNMSDGMPYVIFGIKTKEIFKISLSAGQSISLESFNLYLSAKEQKLYAPIKFFSEDKKSNAVIEFGAKKLIEPDTYDISATIHVKEFSLGNFFKALKIPCPKAFGDLAVKESRVALSNLFNERISPAVEIIGSVDFSSLVKGSFLKDISGLSLESLASKIKISQEGVFFEAGLGVAIPLIPGIDVFSIKDPALMLNVPFQSDKNEEKAEPELMLQGGAELTIPGVGKIDSTLSTAIRGTEIESIKGIARVDIPAFKDVLINSEGRISISPKLGSIQVGLSGEIPKVKVPAGIYLTITKKPSTKKGDKKTEKFPFDIKAYGELAQGQNDFSFFKGVPGLEHVTSEDMQLGFDLDDQQMFLKGTVGLYGLKMSGEFFIGPTGLRVKVKPPANWKLTDVACLEKLKGTFVEELAPSMDKNMFILNLGDPYYDEDLKMMVKEKVTFASCLDLDINKLPIDPKIKDVIEKLRGVPFIPKLPRSVIMAGTIGTSLEDFSLKIYLNIDVDFYHGMKNLGLPPIPIAINNFGFSIIGIGPAVSAFGEVLFWPIDTKPGTPFPTLKFQDEPMILSGNIKIDPVGIALAGGFEGEFKNVVLNTLFPGLNLALANCFLSLGWTWQDLAALTATTGFPWPTAFGIAGDAQIGEIIAGAKLSIPGSAIQNWGFQAFLNHLSLKDLVTILEACSHIKIPGKENLPDLGFYGAKKNKKLEISASLLGANIAGRVSVSPGFKCGGMLKIFDKFSLVDVELTLNRLAARATYPEIEVGPLLITGKGIDGQKGPGLDIEISLLRQHVGLSGEIVLNTKEILKVLPGANKELLEKQFDDIFQARSKTEITLDKYGLNFDLETKLFGLYEASLKGKTITQGADFDVFVEGKIKQTVIEKIQSEMQNFVSELYYKMKNDLAQTAEQIKGADIIVLQKQDQIKKNNTEIEALNISLAAQESQAQDKYDEILKKHAIRPEILNLIKGGVRDVGTLQKKIRGDIDQRLEDAQKEVDKISRQIKLWEGRRAVCASSPWWRADMKIEWSGLNVLIAGAWVTHGIVWGILEGIQKASAGLPTIDEIDSAAKAITLLPKSTKEYARRASLLAENNRLDLDIFVMKKSQDGGLSMIQAFDDLRNFAGQISTSVAKNIKTVNIKEAFFSASLRELFVEGKLPRICLKMDALGRQLPDFAVQFDFKDPLKLSRDIADYVLRAIQMWATRPVVR